MTTIEIPDDYIAKFSRWGLWGDNDQLGAMNLVGPEQVRTAAALVRDGRVISLALPFDQNGPQPGGLRSNPRLVSTATGTDHLAGVQGPVVSGFSDDMVIMGTQCGTQWDALSHIFYRGRMWNGYSAAEHTSIGAARNGIQQWRGTAWCCGVLVDLPTHRGVTSLDPGYAVTVDDLEETLAARKAYERGSNKTWSCSSRCLKWRRPAGGAVGQRWGQFRGPDTTSLSLCNPGHRPYGDVAIGVSAQCRWGQVVTDYETAGTSLHAGEVVPEILEAVGTAEERSEVRRVDENDVAGPLASVASRSAR